MKKTRSFLFGTFLLLMILIAYSTNTNRNFSANILGEKTNQARTDFSDSQTELNTPSPTSTFTSKPVIYTNSFETPTGKSNDDIEILYNKGLKLADKIIKNKNEQKDYETILKNRDVLKKLFSDLKSVEYSTTDYDLNERFAKIGFIIRSATVVLEKKHQEYIKAEIIDFLNSEPSQIIQNDNEKNTYYIGDKLEIAMYISGTNKPLYREIKDSLIDKPSKFSHSWSDFFNNVENAKSQYQFAI